MAFAVLLIIALAQTPGPADLPPDLPHLTFDTFLPVVREQVQKAYAAAQASPDDAEASGQLGMVLDWTNRTIRPRSAIDARICSTCDRSRWLYYLGWVQEAQGRHEKAAASLGGAVWLKRTTSPPSYAWRPACSPSASGPRAVPLPNDSAAAPGERRGALQPWTRDRRPRRHGCSDECLPQSLRAVSVVWRGALRARDGVSEARSGRGITTAVRALRPEQDRCAAAGRSAAP